VARFLYRENRFVRQKKKLVSGAARKKLDLGIGLPVIGFKAERQLTVVFDEFLLCCWGWRVGSGGALRGSRAMIGGLACGFARKASEGQNSGTKRNQVVLDGWVQDFLSFFPTRVLLTRALELGPSETSNSELAHCELAHSDQNTANYGSKNCRGVISKIFQPFFGLYTKSNWMRCRRCWSWVGLALSV